MRTEQSGNTEAPHSRRGDSNDAEASITEGKTPPRVTFETELLCGEIVETISAMLISQGITQRELARRADIAEARVSRILNGRENLTLKSVAELGLALGLRFEFVPTPFSDRSDTPANQDPDPPDWIRRQREKVLSSELAEGPPARPGR